jgi:ubiquinone/menaquinone biosynthesis C-methylase UbiE
MPWKYTEEYYRDYTRTTWDESAEAYVKLMRYLEPFRVALVAGLEAKAGERVLDLGTGPGEPAMTIAHEVGTHGHVSGVDLSEKMVGIASRVAKARGLQNVDFATMDCSELTFPPGTFDAVVSSFGFQIFTDPEKAAREAHRVTRDGGRICVSVWSTGDRVPFLDAIIAPMLENAEPDETGYIPTPYEIGGPGEMMAFLEAAGFKDPHEHRVQRIVLVENEETYLDAVLKGTPIGHSLAEEDPDVQKEVLRKTRLNLQKWATPTGLALPAECVIVSAMR